VGKPGLLFVLKTGTQQRTIPNYVSLTETQLGSQSVYDCNFVPNQDSPLHLNYLNIFKVRICNKTELKRGK
jgi:hypothetical protein